MSDPYLAFFADGPFAGKQAVLDEPLVTMAVPPVMTTHQVIRPIEPKPGLDSVTYRATLTSVYVAGVLHTAFKINESTDPVLT